MTGDDLFTTPDGTALSSGCTSSPAPPVRASSGVHGNALKLRVQAPAASGQANAAVLRLLAREFGAPAASLRLTGGETSRDKRVLFTGLPLGEFADRLARVLARAG